MTQDTDLDDSALNAVMLTLTADIVAAHVRHNSVAVGDVHSLITNVHDALSGLNDPAAPHPVTLPPAVPIRSSIKPDYLICLEDGKKFKMLKRHLMSKYQLSPDAYRAKWGLHDDYPMVAPNYARHRKKLAIENGLGHKPSASPKTAPKSMRGRGSKKTVPKGNR